MKEVKGNLWTFDVPGSNCIRCITTNGTVKKNGHAVMGRGCALEASKKYRGLTELLGEAIERNGNIVMFLRGDLLTFPVKYEWYEKADLDLIKMSAERLKDIAVLSPHAYFILPRPGCGNGHRTWEEVKPLLEILPDNVLVIDF